MPRFEFCTNRREKGSPGRFATQRYEGPFGPLKISYDDPGFQTYVSGTQAGDGILAYGPNGRSPSGGTDRQKPIACSVADLVGHVAQRDWKGLSRAGRALHIQLGARQYRFVMEGPRAEILIKDGQTVARSADRRTGELDSSADAVDVAVLALVTCSGLAPWIRTGVFGG